MPALLWTNACRYQGQIYHIIQHYSHIDIYHKIRVFIVLPDNVKLVPEYLESWEITLQGKNKSDLEITRTGYTQAICQSSDISYVTKSKRLITWQ